MVKTYATGHAVAFCKSKQQKKKKEGKQPVKQNKF